MYIPKYMFVLIKKKLFNMAMIEREEEQKQQQQAEQYDIIRQWEARERERDEFPHPITTNTQEILMQVGLLKFYEEATSSLKAHSVPVSYTHLTLPTIYSV